MIEKMGENSLARAGVSLAAMTRDAIEPIPINERQSINGNLLSTRESLERTKGDNRASEGDKTSS